MRHISEYLDEAMREIYEERAAIAHFDGGLSVEEAEQMALAEVQKITAKKSEK